MTLMLNEQTEDNLLWDNLEDWLAERKGRNRQNRIIVAKGREYQKEEGAFN